MGSQSEYVSRSVQSRHMFGSIPLKRIREGGDTSRSMRPLKRSLSSPVVTKIECREPVIARAKKLTLQVKSSGLEEKADFSRTPVKITTNSQSSLVSPGTPKIPRDIPLAHEFSSLTLGSPRNAPIQEFRALGGKTLAVDGAEHESSTRPHPVYTIPEVLEIIFRFVSIDSSVPQERTRTRKKTEYLRYASSSIEIRERASRTAADKNTSTHEGGSTLYRSNLYNCLLVNKLWHKVCCRILREKIFFSDSTKLTKFVNSGCNPTQNDRPELLVLHKLTRMEQGQLDSLFDCIACTNLKWLELYICPRVLPKQVYLQNANKLLKLVIPGNKVINDKYLMQMCTLLPNLETLDLRACDKVGDAGILSIATHCPKLRTINLGRHRNGHLITSVAVVALARHTQLETLGVAGCHVNDAGLWELAALRGSSITRLSLNNCRLLSNHSLPALMSINSFPNLTVLEIRNTNITNVRPLIRYKQWKMNQGIPILLEGCERLSRLFAAEELLVYRENSVNIIQDLTNWVNKEE